MSKLRWHNSNGDIELVEVNQQWLNKHDEQIRTDERAKVLDEVDKYLRELSDIKSGCGEWIEHHDAKVRADVIDEFSRAINSRLLRFVPTDYDDILFIAKQLKENKDE